MSAGRWWLVYGGSVGFSSRQVVVNTHFSVCGLSMLLGPAKDTRNCDKLPEGSQRAPRELPESSNLQALVKYMCLDKPIKNSRQAEFLRDNSAIFSMWWMTDGSDTIMCHVCLCELPKQDIPILDIQPPQSMNSYLEVRYKERGHTPTLRSWKTGFKTPRHSPTQVVREKPHPKSRLRAWDTK